MIMSMKVGTYYYLRQAMAENKEIIQCDIFLYFEKQVKVTSKAVSSQQRSVPNL